METRQGRFGPISTFINEEDGCAYIVSTIPCNSRGIRITGKELVGFDSNDDVLKGFHPEFNFDVLLQACVYRLPERKKIFFINQTDSMPIQEFHALISEALMRSHIQDMFGALCIEKYEEIGFAAVPAKMGFLRKRQHVFLITRSREAG